MSNFHKVEKCDNVWYRFYMENYFTGFLHTFIPVKSESHLRVFISNVKRVKFSFSIH